MLKDVNFKVALEERGFCLVLPKVGGIKLLLPLQLAFFLYPLCLDSGLCESLSLPLSLSLSLSLFSLSLSLSLPLSLSLLPFLRLYSNGLGTLFSHTQIHFTLSLSLFLVPFSSLFRNTNYASNNRYCCGKNWSVQLPKKQANPHASRHSL